MSGPAIPSRAALRWLFVIQLVSMGAMEMSAPFWPLHLAALGQLSQQALAWASSIAYAGPMLTAMCFTPLWGRLGDRIGHKPMLLRALIALAVTQLWVAAADDTASILAARLVQGALAGFIAAAQAYGASLVLSERRGSLMAKLQVATAIGSIAGPLAGGWIFDAFGFRALNVVAAVICLFAAAAAGIALPAAPSATKAKAKQDCMTGNAARPFALGAFYGLLLAIMLVQAGKMMPQAFFGLFAQQVLHTQAWVIGLCYGATAIGLCIAAPFWGKRFENKSRAGVLREVELISWACAAVVAAQAMTDDVSIFVVTRVLWGICLAALLPVFYGLLSRDADAQHQGRVLGAGNSAAKAGALLGIGAGGLALAALPIQHVFWPVAMVYVLAAVGLRIIRRKADIAASGAHNIAI
jgi:MFS family permease